MKLKRQLRPLLGNRVFTSTFLFSLVSIIVLWVLPFIYVRPLDGISAVPLHYNVYFGIDLIAAWQGVLFIPGFVTFVLLLNVTIALLLQKESKLLSQILLIGHALVSFTGLAALFFVMLINA